MNDRWCVRCGRTVPCPYLKNNIKHLPKAEGNPLIVDIGCGNGRNSEYLKSIGYDNVHSFDMVGDYGTKITLGKEIIPVMVGSTSVILSNYVLMFLSDRERDHVIQEIKRIAKRGCVVMVELYPAKDSKFDTKEKIIKLQKEVFDSLGWKKIKYSQERFIATNG